MARSVARGQSLSVMLGGGGVKWMSPWVVNRRRQSSASDANADPLIRKLEDAIHRIVVRRSAPDWLPFVPGASYWVPPPSPQPSNALAQLLHDLANPNPNPNPNPIPIPPPHSFSMSTSWPSSSYFFQDDEASCSALEVDASDSNSPPQPQDEDDIVQQQE